LRKRKDHLASWRHSADTATIARRSKVIAGHIRDVRPAGNLQVTHAKERRIAKRCHCSPTRICRADLYRAAVPAGAVSNGFVTRMSCNACPAKAGANNRPSSHCCRKMVCITRQGDLQRRLDRRAGGRSVQ
jgi:hypothetical protein